jgi:hypothetical protein
MTITTARTWHTPRRFVLIAAAMALLGASLAACSSTGNQAPTPTARLTGPPQASSAPDTPASQTSAATNGSQCGLVTASEVSAATGKAMGQGHDAGTICSYSATADPSTVVYVQLYTDAGSMGGAKATEPGSEHVPGLGDDAFWTAYGTMFVQKGSRGFTISTPSLALTSTSAPQAILTLATAALTRL